MTAFIRQLIPPMIRKEPLISLCEVVFRPMKTLFQEFFNYSHEATLEITATGQIIVLEYNLCRLMSLPINYIYIAASSHADFAVLVPDFLTSKQIEIIRRYVEAHKLSGKSFEIIVNV